MSKQSLISTRASRGPWPCLIAAVVVAAGVVGVPNTAMAQFLGVNAVTALHVDWADHASAGGTQSTAVGDTATASGNFSTAIGNSARVIGHYGTAIGHGSTVTDTSDFGTAVG
jgi:hypothetical protein